MIAAWKHLPTAARAGAGLWIAAAVAGCVLVVRRAWVTDDIFITFRYCDNLLAGLGPVYNPGERCEGYTHFLWLLLLTLGRAVGIPADFLGRYAGLPFFAGSLLLLVRISARLFPGRGGLAGVPAAMLGWVLLEDARLFASGGLETAAFTFFLLLGFECLCREPHPHRGARTGWAFAVACLLRPDGLLAAVLAGAFLAWRDRRALRDYAAVWLVLVAPLFVFRLLYYGYPLPNPYYAKSGGGSNWAQGWIYARLYFGIYPVLLAALAAAGLAGLGLVRRPRRDAAAPALAWAFTLAALTALYVIRVGGDFMFARFFLPTTPFLLLLVESLVHRLPRPAWRLAATLLLAALLVHGAVRKHHLLDRRREIRGIVDEPQFYPEWRLAEIRTMAQTLSDCLAGTRAVVLVQGGQASLAYYARLPVAIERYGLTDETIAHGPVPSRGRPGHEKGPTGEYVYGRGVNLRIHYVPVRNVPQYALFGLTGMTGDIFVYDRALMDHMKACAGARFLDFPRWLADTYIPSIPEKLPLRLVDDWTRFQRFYFDHNPDPEGLRDRLRAALAARGLRDLPTGAAPEAILETDSRPHLSP